MGTTLDLLDRVEKATEGSRELDVLLGSLTDDTYDLTRSLAEFVDKFGLAWAVDAANSHSSILYHTLPRFSASIDAALALVERLLGHAATVELCTNIGSAQHSCSIHLFEREEPVVTENLRTPALAILAALLRAMLEQSP
jgi:hypothetical protein